MGRSDFLFATPGFLTGFGRAIDLGAVLEQSSYNLSQTAAEADTRAIEQDWGAVGGDLRRAVAAAKVSESE